MTKIAKGKAERAERDLRLEGTRNREKGTRNKEQGEGNKEQGTGRREQGMVGGFFSLKKRLN